MNKELDTTWEDVFVVLLSTSLKWWRKPRKTTARIHSFRSRDV